MTVTEAPPAAAAAPVPGPAPVSAGTWLTTGDHKRIGLMFLVGGLLSVVWSTALVYGFIHTAMLWGAALAFLIDRRIARAAAVLGSAAVLAAFGLIHSVLPTGGIYLPWSPSLLGSRTPYHWAAAYVLLAGTVVGLARTRAFAESEAPGRKVA